MKSLKKGIISLLAFVMALTLTPSVFAGTDDATGSSATPKYKVTNPGSSSADGLYSNKTLTLNDDGTGTITLETYVTGTIQQTGTPTDVVLVLDVSQSMVSNKMGNITRLQALKNAVTTFINTTAKKNENAKTDAQKNRISIVSFAGKNQINLVSDFSSDKTALTNAVNGMRNGQGTAADYGLNKALSQINSIPSSRESNKVVIFFTDGEPNWGSGNFDGTVANNAIATAKKIEAAGAKVYSIGVFTGADPTSDPTAGSTSDLNKFLHGVSSNYPDATAYTSLGTRAKDSSGNALTCYKSATNASELEKIFEDIGEEAVPAVKLDEETLVQDVMSEYVVSNISDTNKIKLYTSAYTGKDSAGNLTFADPVAAPSTVTAEENDGKVEVTGFDFEPVIDKTATTYQGKKLIVEIPVKLTDAAKKMSGETLNSNDADSSAIYNKDKTGVLASVRGFGTPTVEIPKTKITIKANSNEKTYDGSALTEDGYSYDEHALVDGDKLTAVVEGSQTDAGSSANVVKSYKVMRGDKDVTDKYDISTENGTLTVNKKDVEFKGDSKTVTYNGQKQSVETFTEDGLVSGQTYEGLTYKASGTDADTYKGAFSGEVKIKDGDKDVTDNYNVKTTPGELVIKPIDDEVVVTIEGNTEEETYDGTEKSATGYKVTTSNELYTENDFSFSGDATASGIDVATYPMNLSKDKFANTSKNFTNVTFKVTDGKLIINKRPVTFTGESDTVTYDAQEHELTKITKTEGLLENDTYSGLTYSAKGTDVGDHPGTFSGEVVIKNANDEDVTKNYNVTTTPGTLTITKADLEVTIVGNKEEFNYNGSEQKAEGYTTPNLPAGVTVSLKEGKEAVASGTNAGTYSMGLKEDSFEIKSDNYKIAKVTVTDGELKINQIPVTITVGDAEKVYGEDDPSFDDAAMAGQVEGELTDINLSVTRSDAGTDDGEKLGKHEGVLQIKDTKEALEKEYTNYTFTVKKGNFTINENEKGLSLEILDNDKVYDGKALSTSATAGIEGATIKYKDKDGNYTLDECPTITDVGTKKVEAQATLYGYAPATASATLTVNPKDVTLTSQSASQIYNGEALTRPEVSGGDAFVEGEVTDIKAIGSITNVGTTKNDITYATTSDKFKADNYNITLNLGTLEVTPAVIKVVTPSAKKAYDGKPLTKEGSMTGLVNEDDAKLITTGTQTKVGKSNNTYEIEWLEPATKENYTVEEEIGVLEVYEPDAPAEEEDEDNPDTGDNSNVVLYGFIGLTALAAELFVVSRKRRSNEK